MEKSNNMSNRKDFSSSEKNTSEIFRTINLEEFPALQKSHKNQNAKENSMTVSYKPQQNSWLTVVNSQARTKSSEEAFPALAGSRNYQRKEKGPGFSENSQSSHSFLSSQKSEEGNKIVNTVQNTKPKKKNVSKNPASISIRNPNKKKRADPIFINLGEVIQGNKKEKQSRNIKSKIKRRVTKEQLSGNYLDSSKPKRCKGKHREIKKRKFSNLKLAIIKERIVKQKIREKALSLYFGNESSELFKEIDFKVEIRKYLEDLSVRKIDNKEFSKTETVKNCDVGVNSELKVKSEEKINKHQRNQDKNTVVQELKFSSKLREYCDNIVTPELNSAVAVFIKELINLQDKLFARDPIKARAKKRHVSGLNEVKKYLTLKKIKMIIIAPNLEKMQMKGSIFDIISNLKTEAENQKVPCVFALDRYKLGRCTKKNVPVSAFGVLNYEGIENLHENVLEQLAVAKKQFAEMSKPKIKAVKEEPSDQTEEVTSKLISSFISIFREELSFNESQGKE